MPFAKVCDLNMYYERRGSGPRLLYVGGTGGDLRRKPTVFDRPLAQHFDILTYDQRGLGQTKGPRYDYTMADYAEDAKALLDLVGWDKCHYMGVSFGGMVGQEFAIRYPERLDRVVWCCTSSGGAGGASYPLHKYMDDTLEQRARRQLTNADLRHDPAWQAAHAAEFQTMLDTLMEGLRIGRDDPELVAGQKRQLLARAGLDTYDCLPSLRLPILICAGKYDGIAPIANQHALHQQIPNSRLEFFEGGHGFLAEDPRAFEAITAFLKEIDDGSRN